MLLGIEKRGKVWLLGVTFGIAPGKVPLTAVAVGVCVKGAGADEAGVVEVPAEVPAASVVVSAVEEVVVTTGAAGGSMWARLKLNASRLIPKLSSCFSEKYPASSN